MEEPECTNQPSGLAKNRIETLTDGIFAIAMTLLILGIEVPQQIPRLPLFNLLQDLFPDILQYIVAFLILAVFWVIHHNQFHSLLYVDTRLLWLNIIWLLFVGGMPFSTSLAETYLDNSWAMVIFGCNIMAIALILNAQWNHATIGHCLVDPSISDKLVSIEHRRVRLILGLAIAGTVAAIFSVYLGIIIFAAIPVTFALNTRLTRNIPWMLPAQK